MNIEIKYPQEVKQNLDVFKKEVKKYIPFNTDDFQKKQDEKEISENKFEDVRFKANRLISFFTGEKVVVEEYRKNWSDFTKQDDWKELEKDIEDIMKELNWILKNIKILEKRLKITNKIKIPEEDNEEIKDIIEYNRNEAVNEIYDELDSINRRLSAIWDEWTNIINRKYKLSE